MIDIDKTIEGDAVLSIIKNYVASELCIKTYSLAGIYLNFKAGRNKIEVQLLKHGADEEVLSDIADFLENKNVKKTVYDILKKIQPICGQITVDGTYIEMKEENENGKNNTGLSIETLKRMGYNYPFTVRRIIEGIEQGKDLKDIKSELIESRIAEKQNGHILFLFSLSDINRYNNEIENEIRMMDRMDIIFFIDRVFVPSNDRKLLHKVFNAIRDEKTVEEALERLKEEDAENARECCKIDDFFIRRLGNSLFFDVTTKGGFLTVKVNEYRLRKALPNCGNSYYDFAKPFIGKDFRTFIEAIKDAVIEITENVFDFHAKKEAPAPANTAAACDDTAKAKDSDKEEAANATAKANAAAAQEAIEGNKKWLKEQLDNIEFTRVEFDKAKAKQSEKSEPPCDLQCAVSFCKDIFEKKFGLYGASFCDMHPETVTDQLLMKATILKKQLTDRDKSKSLEVVFFEVFRDEFAAIVNYGIIALRQAGFGLAKGIAPESHVRYHACKMQEALSLICKKGADYGDLWREQRIGTFADMIYTKVRRLKSIENQYRVGGMTEGGYKKFAGDQYKDLINYGLFGVVRMTEIIDYLQLEMEDYESDEEEDYE